MSIADELGPYEAILNPLKRSTIRWWVAGGWALDLYLKQLSRSHSDLDLAYVEQDENDLRRIVEDLGDLQVVEHDPPRPGYDLTHLALPGKGKLRFHLQSGKAVDLLPMRARDSWWVIGRDDVPIRSLDDLSLEICGLPVLAPEIVLLFKARLGRDVDWKDLLLIRPHLYEANVEWLRLQIGEFSGSHPWIEQL